MSIDGWRKTVGGSVARCGGNTAVATEGKGRGREKWEVVEGRWTVEGGESVGSCSISPCSRCSTKIPSTDSSTTTNSSQIRSVDIRTSILGVGVSDRSTQIRLPVSVPSGQRGSSSRIVRRGRGVTVLLVVSRIEGASAAAGETGKAGRALWCRVAVLRA